MAESRLKQVSALGQSVWVDFLSRQSLQDGTVERLIAEDAVVGMTSNPTIFQAAMADGDAYDEQLREVLEHETDGKEIFLALVSRDIQAACDLLRPVWEHTEHLDGHVSLEVDPNLAYDQQATIGEAKRLHELIDRQNLYIKIPATEPGLGAIEQTIAAGIPVNVTLIFSLERHRRVAEAYLRGIERLLDAGGDPSDVPSVASFFLSRVDTEADKRLDVLEGHERLRGRLAIASAKLAYQQYRQIFSGERWEALKSRGARPQRCLWASTSVKDKRYRDTMYVEELIGRDTVNTLPPETVDLFQDHGRVGPTLERDIDEAQRVLDALADAGVDYDDVTATLEREGVQKFVDAFQELFEDVKAKRDQLAAPHRA